MCNEDKVDRMFGIMLLLIAIMLFKCIIDFDYNSLFTVIMYSIILTISIKRPIGGVLFLIFYFISVIKSIISSQPPTIVNNFIMFAIVGYFIVTGLKAQITLRKGGIK